MNGIKYQSVTSADRLNDLIANAEIYHMTVEEYLAHEQWESVEQYINFAPGLGWQHR